MVASATFPNDVEFHTFWSSFIKRCEASEKKSNWSEPEVATYFKKSILNCSTDMIRAPWVSGLGAVPVGYSTYAANAEERKHRIIKDLLGEGYERFNAAEIMCRVCEVMTSRMHRAIIIIFRVLC